MNIIDKTNPKSSFRKYRKSQISTFIIIGIVMIIIIALLITFTKTSNKNISKDNIDILNYKNILDSCTRSAAVKTVHNAGLAGFVFNPKYSDKSVIPSLSVILKDSVSYLPPLSEIEQDLITIFKADFQSCSDSNTNNSNLIIQNPRISISNSSVTFYPDAQLEIFQGQAHQTVSSSPYTIKARLGLIHNMMQKIIKSIIINDHWLNLDIAYNYDISIALSKTDEGNTYFAVIDNKSIIENENSFILYFATD